MKKNLDKFSRKILALTIINNYNNNIYFKKIESQLKIKNFKIKIILIK